jgi:hypothetical protein
MKKLITMLLVTILTLLSLTNTFALQNTVTSTFTLNNNEDSQNLKVSVNSKAVVFPDAKPFVDENSRTMVPVRFVTEALGCTVTWIDNGTNGCFVQIIREQPYTRIVLEIDKNYAIVNTKTSDSKIIFDTTTKLLNDRTFVPARFVSETMNYFVDWDSNSNTVIIDTSKTPIVTPTPTPLPTPPQQAKFSVSTGSPKYEVIMSIRADDEDTLAKMRAEIEKYYPSSIDAVYQKAIEVYNGNVGPLGVWDYAEYHDNRLIKIKVFDDGLSILVGKEGVVY